MLGSADADRQVAELATLPTDAIGAAVARAGADLALAHLLRARPLPAVVAAAPEVTADLEIAANGWALGMLQARAASRALDPSLHPPAIDLASDWIELGLALACTASMALPGMGPRMPPALVARATDLWRTVTLALLDDDLVAAARLLRWAALTGAATPHGWLKIALERVFSRGKGDAEATFHALVAAEGGVT